MLLKLTLVSSCFAIWSLLAASASAQGQAQRAPYVEGQFWVYRLKSSDWYSFYSSTRLLSGTYKILYSKGRFKYFYVDENGNEESIAVHPTFRWLLGQSPRDFHFPLAVDKKWNYQYPWKLILNDGATDRNLTRTAEINVVAVETVTTQAGTFKAFKLVKEDWNVRRYGVVTTYYWSPETRSVVKSFYDSSVDTNGTGGKAEFELLKRGVVGQAPLVAGEEASPSGPSLVNEAAPTDKTDQIK